MIGSEIDQLINSIAKLPGLGRRSAQRIALHLLKHKEKSLKSLMEALKEASSRITNCDSCGNIDTLNPCSICQDKRRDRKTICIVEDISDLWAFERTGIYRGLYYVLGGVLSAIDGIGIDELRISKLINQIPLSDLLKIFQTTFPSRFNFLCCFPFYYLQS